MRLDYRLSLRGLFLLMLSACRSFLNPSHEIGKSDLSVSQMVPTKSLPPTLKHQFALFHLNRIGAWDQVDQIASGSRPVTLMLHGFKHGDRSKDHIRDSSKINAQFGLVDFSRDLKFVSAPVNSLQTEVYAMMWDSRAKDPWQLEHLLMGGRFDLRTLPKAIDRRAIDRSANKPSANNPNGDQAKLEFELSSDHIEDETDTEFFTDLYQWYDYIFADYHGQRPKIAGFSKGGHLAIKLALYAIAKSSRHGLSYDSSKAPQALALLDTYVGPAWANGNLGSKLMSDIRALKKANVGILNVITSDIYEASLLGVPLSDTWFRDDLAREVGELKIVRNPKEIRSLANVRGPTKIPGLNQFLADHSRAPQYFFGTALMCDVTQASINSIDLKSVKPIRTVIEMPTEISDWLYDGVFHPSCGNIEAY